MDAEKVAFILGELPNGTEGDDGKKRRHLVKQRIVTEFPDLDDGSAESALIIFVHQLVADQIADDEPPEVWLTARRLLGLGFDARTVMINLVAAATSALTLSDHPGASLDDAVSLDAAEYIEELDDLPLPPVREMFEVFVASVREDGSITPDELIARTVASLVAGEERSDEAMDGDLELLVGQALDELIELEPSMMMLPPDLLVHVPTLSNGAVLTHRLSESEHSGGRVATGADLAPLLLRSEELLMADGSEILYDDLGGGQGILEGPDGWLDRFLPGTLIGFRIDGDILSLESLVDTARPAPSVVEAARKAYDREVREPWLPVRAEQIVAGMLLDHPGILETPTVPISELLANAGLEQRGVEFAHEESVWREAHRNEQGHRLYHRLPDYDTRRMAARILDLLDAKDRGPEEMREALSTLRDPAMLHVLADELLDLDNDEAQLEEISEFANDLLSSARRAAEGAPARFLLAMVCERRCDPLAGQAHLELAVQADPEFAPAVDRLAWYLSDRGDAVGAVRLWRRLGFTEDDHDDLSEITKFAETRSRDLGRNEPCWCGSGRKYKHCHLGEPPAFPLNERVGWLCRKSVAYLQRRGGWTREDVYKCAVTRADGDDSEEALSRAFSDPILLDAVLHEGGWFETFLEERGVLLPDDEALLATAWALVERTLYEAVEVRPGEGLVVRDLRTADLIEVRERAFSRQIRVGQIFCGRAVPDGEHHQLIGGVFAVATGEEKRLLNMLDERNGELLLSWVAAKERPPRMTTRESEDLIICKAVLQVPDPEVAREVLDRMYGADVENCWREHHRLANGESILRATITLEGAQITVETMSEPRVERVLSVLTSQIPGTKVISDDRDEIDLSSPLPGPPQPPLSKDDPQIRDVLRKFFAERERIWCDEAIPALGGLTPREAAADPVGRESLERLLAEYGSHIDPEQDPDDVPQHPERLRQLLGLL